MVKSIAILSLVAAIVAGAFCPVVASAQTPPAPMSSLIVKLVTGLTADQQAEVIARNGGIEISAIRALRLHVVAVPTSDLDATLASYQADPQVVRVELNKVRQTETVAPSDPLYPNQWALPQISWNLVFGTTMPTGSATVAILDTGIDATHPDLASQVVAGTSILDGSAGTTDPNGHGTWMAGIVAAQTNAIPPEGIAGVAYAGVRMMPVTVLDSNGLGQDSDVIAGVIWAADNGANVILMGFSNPGFSPNLQDAIDYAWSQGAILVAATGNGGSNTPTFPAGDRGVMGVAATDAADSLAGFSNYGQAAFLAAPGTNIQTTDLGGSYTMISGTSTSAAIVAGAAAFMKAVDPSLSNGVIVGRMARMADPAGTQEQTGNGRVNMARALADTGTDPVIPGGADPVGAGGPFVGPYQAAARNTVLTFAGTGTGSVTITPSTGTINAPVSCGGTGTNVASQTVTSTCSPNITTSDNGATVTFNASAGSGSVFAGWSAPNNLSSSTCSGTTNPCSAVLGANPALTVTFNANPTTTSISPTSKVVGEAAFTLTVNGTKFASGAVVKFNGSSRTTAFVSSTQVTASIPASDLTSAGTFSITVVNPDGGTSNAQTFTVNKANTSTTLTSSANPSVSGQSVTFTATVAAVAPGSGTPTGSVTFKDGATTLGTGTLNGSGQATFSTSGLSVGSHSITAVYGGDANYLTSTSATVSQAVNQGGTSTVLTSSTNPSVFGQSVTFTATVSAVAPATGTPSGTVTFKDGATTIGTGTLNGSGQASFATSALSVTSHSITAVYEGNTSFATSTSAALSQTVNKASTTTTVSSSANPSVFGQSVTFTATVGALAPGAGTPSGTVTFLDGATTLGTGTLSGGQATFTTSSLSVGSHSITASYGSDGNFNASTSGALSQTVNKADTTTTLNSSANPSAFGQSVTFTATVSPVAPGAGTPSGTVTFKDGATTIGTGTLSGGQASVTTGSLAVGGHSITAQFGGDTNFNTSASGALSQTVSQASTSTAVTSSANPSAFGQAVTFTATVSVTGAGSGTPTGTVTFKDGTTTLGTGTLSGGQATFTTSSLSTAPHSITAVYGGDTNFSGSTSATLVQTVNQATTSTAVVSGTNPSKFGQSVTFTATVSVTGAGAGTPTGTVTFKDGTTTLGTGTLDGSGQATFTTSSLGTGPHSVTAVYGSDINFAGSTSSTLTQTVDAGDTTTAVSSDTNPATTGATVTFTATVSVVAPASGTPSGTVTFKDGATTLGTGTLNASAQATFSTSTLTDGSHSITAVYGGDGSFNGSTSNALSQVVDTPPTGTGDIFLTQENTTLTVNAPGVLANDNDADSGQNLSVDSPVIVDTGTTHGTLHYLHADGSFSYTPTAGFTGTDSFTYRATDGIFPSAPVTVTIAVVAPTATPVAEDDAYHIAQDTALTVTAPGLLDNDQRTLGHQLSAVLDTTTTHGVLALSADDSFTYTPTSGFTGVDTFTYHVHDATSNTDSNVAMVIIAVRPAGATPVGANDAYRVDENAGPVTFAVPGVLGNDTGSSLSAQLVTEPLYGSMTLNANGSFTYTPAPDFAGRDSFLYRAQDSTGAFSNLALVRILVSAQTSTTVSSSANPAVFGQAITFTATLTPAAATGAVQFKIDGVDFGSPVTVASGTATSGSVSSLSVGNHIITAVYTSDSAEFLDSTSANFSQTVNKADTTTLVVSSANPSVFGQPVTFTATVSAVAPGAGTPSGTVTFKDGATTLGTGTLSSGQATLTISSLTVGSHSITASYGGDTNFNTSTSTTLAQVVNKADTATSVVSSANPSVFGQSVTFTATVAAVGPGSGTSTGAVTFKDGSTVLATVTLSGGVATFTTSSLSVGSHSVTASYGGDTNFNTSTSATLAQVVNKADTTTSVVSSANPSKFGQSVTFTVTVAAVAPGTGTPTGTVTFKDGTTTLGTGTLNSSAQATFTTSALAVGPHSITVEYGGDPSFNGSTSAALNQTVNKADTSSTVSSSVNPSKFGQSVTFTATVTAVAPGSGTPSGTVTFLDGATTLGTGTLSGGQASFVTSALTVGNHSITVSYSGDGNFNASNSSALTQTVQKADTATAVISDINPSRFGQSVTFTATVSVTGPGAGTPTGSVTFKDGATTLGAGALDGSGHATFSSAALGVGPHSITGEYSGDSNFNSSASSALSQVVNKADTTTGLTSDNNPAVAGSAVTFTATVSVVAPGAGTPGGTVTFKDGSTTLGTGTLNASAQATFSTSTLTDGSHSITAVYGGDPSFNGSTSAALTQVVDTPPTGTGDIFVTQENTTLTVNAPGVLANDNDVDSGQSLSVDSPVTADTATTHGTLHYLHADGSFSYTPNATFTGTDSFTYRATDGIFPSALVTVTLSVVAPTATPVAEDDAYHTAQDTPLTVATPGVLDNDQRTLGHQLSAVLNTTTTHGVLSLSSDGSFTYTPSAGFTGVDTFTYHVHDATSSTDSNVAMVLITVQPAGAPVATNDAYRVDENAASVTFAVPGVLGNDTGSSLSAHLVTEPLYGSVTLNPNGSFTYTPAADFAGRDSFLYRAQDSTGAFSNLAMVRILVSAQTSTTVSSSANPAVFGQSVTFTATLTPAAATGTVQFKIDGVDFGSPVTVASGAATSNSTASLSVGTHSVTAVYTSDSTEFLGSTSTAFTQTVNKADTSTVVVADVNPSKFGQAVTFTATVNISGPGAGTRTGTVTFKDGTTTLGTGTLNASNQATFTTSTLAVSPPAHSITAEYGGDGNFNASTSAPLVQTVQKADTSTVVVADVNPSKFGQAVTFTATVNINGAGAGTRTGSVTFKDGATTLGTGALNASNQATFTTSALAVGTHSITAVYGGDGNFNASMSAVFTQTVNKATTTSAVTVTPNSQQYSDVVTFEATLTPASVNGFAPATTVTFFVGSQNMGTVNLAVVGSDLKGTLSNAPLLEPSSPNGQMAPGARTVTAQFGGVDTTHFVVSTPTTPLTITQEDARVTYAGNMFVGIPTSSTTGAITLIATIQDITAVTGDSASDAYPGDIRNATVTFVNRDASNATLCTASVLLVNSSDTKTGSVTCTFTGTVGSTTGSTQYTVGIVVGGYYIRNLSIDDTVVTISQVGAGMITGGGYLLMQHSAGTIAGDPGTNNNFGFNVKYNKSGSNLQGNINAIVRRKESDGIQHVYQIKGNQMASLAVYQWVNNAWAAGCSNGGTPTSPCKAQFNGKANIQDITNPLAPISVSGNNSLQFNMTDKGSPGSGDTIGITLWNGSGGIWFSTNWMGTPPTTVEQVLGGGNLVVH